MDQSLIDIISKIATKYGQSEAEVQNVIGLLNRNWISSLSQWESMTPEQRSLVKLPLILEQELDNLASDPTKLFHHELFEQNSDECLDLELLINNECIIIRDTQRYGNMVYVWSCEDDIQLEMVDFISIRIPKSAPLSNALQHFPPNTSLVTQNGLKISPSVAIGTALLPGRFFAVPFSPAAKQAWGQSGNHHLESTFEIEEQNKQYHLIMNNGHFKAVENWLAELGLRRHAYTFLKHYIDDFLVIPFLHAKDLDDMNIMQVEEKQKILESVDALQNGDNFEYMALWLKYMGFGKYAATFMDNYFEICFLNRLKESHLERIGIAPEDRAPIFEIIKQYSEFSSVEATYTWLRDKGFVKDSFQFVRFNIPFYALPLVNFFIINEMGITDYRRLLNALKELQDSPAYNVKAMAYWLRDLELERYSLVFAKNLLVNFIEALTILTDSQISRLIELGEDREKMKRAVHDMKEFQMYFSATASLLPDLVIEKYAKIFAAHGVTIDVLPMLTDDKLLQMGIVDLDDRKRIMTCVEKMSDESMMGMMNKCYSLCNSKYQPRSP